MIKEAIKSYKSDNRGSAIITGLVVSAVLMVLCLSLLLVAYSLFLSTSNATSDMPNKEMLYSAAEVIGDEITAQTVDVTSYTVLTDNTDAEGQDTTTTIAPSILWDVIYKGISTGAWSYYDGHSDLDTCSKYYQMTSIGSVKLIVQFYWEPPRGWTGDVAELNGALLNAVYRLYNKDDEVLVKASKKYVLTVENKQISSGEGENTDNFIIREPYKKELYQDWWYYGFDNAEVVFRYNGTGSTSEVVISPKNEIVTENWAFDMYLDGVTDVTTNNSYHFTVLKLEDGWYRIKPNSDYTKTLENNSFYVPIVLTGTLTTYPKIRQRNTGGQAQQSGATTHFVEQQIDIQFDEPSMESWSSENSWTYHITITNNHNEPVKNWIMEFDFPGSINTYQGTADLVEVNGQHYKIKDRGSNGGQQIEPGKSFKVTFSGVGTEGYNTGPTNIQLYTVKKIEVNNDSVTIVVWKWNPIG